MLPPTAPAPAPPDIDALLQDLGMPDPLQHFAQHHDQPTMDLLCHAAFPVAMTAELLYLLRDNFLHDAQGHRLSIPWIAVSDVLLWDHCHEVRPELYQFHDSLRLALLDRLRADPRFGEARIRHLAQFTLAYARQAAPRHPRTLTDRMALAARAYLDPAATAAELHGRMAQAAATGQAAEVLALSALVRQLAQPLAGQHTLLHYSATAAQALFDPAQPHTQPQDPRQAPHQPPPATPHDIAAQRMAQCKAQQLPALDLSGLGLRDFPHEALKLRHLTRLDLHGNLIAHLPPDLDRLDALQYLDASNNYLLGLPEALWGMDTLRTLKLGSNQLPALDPELGRLQGLANLSVWGNPLQDIPQAVFTLRGLTLLNCSHLKHAQMPPEIGALTRLQVLGWSDNAATHLPQALGSLEGLQELYLDQNDLEYLPESLANLRQLTKLDLKGNPRLPTVPRMDQRTPAEILDTVISQQDMRPYMTPADVEAWQTALAQQGFALEYATGTGGQFPQAWLGHVKAFQRAERMDVGRVNRATLRRLQAAPPAGPAPQPLPCAFLTGSEQGRAKGDDFLPHVRPELQAARAALQTLAAVGGWAIVHNPDLDPETFLAHLNGMAACRLWHFAGAGSLLRQLQSRFEDPFRRALRAQITQGGLMLVFLNAEHSEGTAERLADWGVPLVIATRGALRPDAAGQAAAAFYESLAGNSPVQAAYQTALMVYANATGMSVDESPYRLLGQDVERGLAWQLLPPAA